MSDKVTSLAETTGSSKSISPEQALEFALKEIRDGTRECNKLLVATLDDRGRGYHVGYYNAQMSTTEILALIHILQSMMREEMGYT